MRNYIFFFIIIALALFALIGGFILIGSPSQSRALKFDEKRIQDLIYLKSEIERIYEKNRTLPVSLNELNPNSKVNLEDPETKLPYEYRIISTESYELCATFATDLKSSGRDYYLPENSQYIKKGRSCLPYDIPKYLITPTQIPQLSPLPLIQITGDTNDAVY